ncbi:YhcN/YlaJ family sporulation lipoprotein [Anaerobacterium chartisolvens]|uniref:YhcN/YlaJ family sporulation lipoprotein n=1 Tax=Anaerobacterium chartisolvens TaxID=1297424 RepID=A0A369B955_9FIRM|nr:YhcN/YlaJ family sporulation lipoprotein [Anaerobacterium chartisolvens]RCX17118.1 YhcN/YlaJ family sporulation lipoprotein [Anaerobacterium chartisolvens]
MIKNVKTGGTVFLGFCLITTMLSACDAGRTSRLPDQQQQNVQQQGIERDNLLGIAPQPEDGGTSGMNPGNNQGANPGVNQGANPGVNQPDQQMAPDRQKAENIKNQLRDITEIADANVIVMGNTALVGYKPSGNMGDSNAAKNMIISKVKKIDRTITNVSVSEQPDMMNRMNRLGEDITNNRPMNDITNEFNQIMRGITTPAH